MSRSEAAASDREQKRASRRRLLWRSVALPLIAYAASRLVVLLSVGVVMILQPGKTFVRTLSVWDVGWYVDVAANGYSSTVPMSGGKAGQSAHAFFPLFPLLERWVAKLTPLSLVSAGVVIALLGGAVAAVLLRWLVAVVAGHNAADRAVVLFCFFPASFVFLIAYSEGVMLPLAVGCLIALLRKRWLVAGVCAALATASRPNAVALCLACAFAAFMAIRRDREWRSLIAPALSPLGAIAFVAFLWRRTGDVMTFWNVQRYGWDQRIDFGWTTVTSLFDVLQQPLDINVIVSAMSVAFAVVATVLVIRWRPPGVLVVYAFGVVVPVLMSAAISSRPRFLLTAFPLVVAMAWRLRGAAFAVAVGASGAMLSALTVLTLGSLAATL